MLRFTLAWLLVFCSFVCNLAAEPKWTKIETPNFTLYTLDSEKEARRAAQHFEEAHRFFESIWRKLDRDKPIRILSFNDSDKGYEQTTPLKKSGAFYLSTADADYIVMRDLSPRSFPIAVHEYMHLVVRHAGLKLPVWLNEGLAEVYSTIGEHKDKVLIGDLPPTHLPFLQSRALLGLPQLMVVGHRDAIYTAGNEETHRFYAQSWALVHMLMLHKDYTPHFNQLLGVTEKRELSPADVETVTGRPLAAIEKDLDKYIRQAMYRGLLYDTKLKGFEADIKAASFVPGEMDLLLAGLKVYRDDYTSFAAALESTAAKYPDSAFAQERLAILAQRQGNRDKEIEHLAKALDLGSTSPFLVMRYAQLTGEDAKALPRQLDSLTRTHKQYPDHLDVLIELSFATSRLKRHIQAYALLASVKKVTPKHASRFFLARAYALMGNKQYKEAADEARRALQYAHAEHDQLNASNLVSSLDRYQASLAAFEASQREAERRAKEAAENLDAPVLRKPEAPAPAPDEVPSAPAEARLEMEASFEVFDCASMVLIVKSTNGKYVRLFLAEPNKLEVKGAGGYTVDLNCGPQKHEPLRVAFLPQSDAKRNTVGLLRSLEFLKGYGTVK